MSGDAAGLEVVGDGDVCAPHVELPLAEPQHAAQHRPGVDPCNTETVTVSISAANGFHNYPYLRPMRWRPNAVKLQYTPRDATISILHDNMLSSPYGTIIILH